MRLLVGICFIGLILLFSWLQWNYYRDLKRYEEFVNFYRHWFLKNNGGEK